MPPPPTSTAVHANDERRWRKVRGLPVAVGVAWAWLFGVGRLAPGFPGVLYNRSFDWWFGGGFAPPALSDVVLFLLVTGTASACLVLAVARIANGPRMLRGSLLVMAGSIGAQLVYISFFFSPVLAPLLLASGALVVLLRLLRARPDPSPTGQAHEPDPDPVEPLDGGTPIGRWKWMRWLLPLEGAVLALVHFFGPLHPSGDFWGRTAWLEYGLAAVAGAGMCAAAAIWVLGVSRMPVRRHLLRSSLAVASGAAVTSLVAFMVYMAGVLSALHDPRVGVYVSNGTDMDQEGSVEIHFGLGSGSLNHTCPIHLGVLGERSSFSSCEVPEPPRERGTLVVTVQLAEGRVAREEVAWPSGGMRVHLNARIGPDSVDFHFAHGD